MDGKRTLELRPVVPLGEITGAELNVIMRVLGLSHWELSKLMSDDPLFDIRKLLRPRDSEGSLELRARAHEALLTAAARHIMALERNLKAQLVQTTPL